MIVGRAFYPLMQAYSDRDGWERLDHDFIVALANFIERTRNPDVNATQLQKPPKSSGEGGGCG